jgi:hypothetical protein
MNVRISCQLIDLDRTVTKILFLPSYHLACEVYMFLFLKDSLIFFVFGHYKTTVTKSVVEEGKTFYDAEGFGVDLYSRWMYNINDHFSCFYYHHFTTT